MTKTILFNRNSLLTKLVLLVMLLVGGGSNVWGEDIVIYNEGSTIPDRWSKNAYASCVDNLIVIDNSNMGYIVSDDNMTFSNKRLVITAKRNIDDQAFLGYSVGKWGAVTYLFGYDYTSKYEIFSKDEFVKFISNIISISDNQFRIVGKNLTISKIELVDDASLLLDEGNLTAIQGGAKTDPIIFKYTPKANWNTICVPFTLKSNGYDHMTTIFGSNWKAYTLDSFEGGVLNFAKACYDGESATLNANTPYLVYAPNGLTQATANPSGFTLSSNVTIAYSNGAANRATSKDDITFQGTYAKVDAPNLAGKYGVTADGQIAKGGTGAYMKGYRAYFEGDLASARMMVIEDDGGTTDLGFVRMVDKDAKDVYNLQGQKVQKGRKGLYVVNGKKVVIK